MVDLTVLKLIGVGVQPYSARGLTQTLAPIVQAAQFARTVNGTLRDLSMEQFRKYSSVITGSDQKPPVCDGVWPGRIIQVECIAELTMVTGGAPSRPVVTDSSYEDGGFTLYRPVLQMMVMSFEMTQDEWQRGVTWSLTLEEV